MAKFLLEIGYEIHSIKRRAWSFKTQRIDHIYEDPYVDNADFRLHYGDLTVHSRRWLLPESQAFNKRWFGGGCIQVVEKQTKGNDPHYTANGDIQNLPRMRTCKNWGEQSCSIPQ
jgi:hypothetical protein